MMGNRQRQAVRAAMAVCMVTAVSGLLRYGSLTEAGYFNKGLISVAVLILGWLGAGKALEQRRENPRRFWLAYGFSLLLAYTELLGICLWRSADGAGPALTAAMALWMLGSAVILGFLPTVVVYWVLERTERIRGGGEVAVRKSPAQNLRRTFLIAWGGIFLAYLPCFFAFYPGLYCYDMDWQWYFFSSGNYNTHHPLIHTILSCGLIEAGYRLTGSYDVGLAVHGLLQLLALSGSCAFAVRFLAKIGTPKAVWLTTTGFFALFPFFPVLGVSTTKDLLFGALMLVVFVCLCDMVRNRQVYQGKSLALFAAATVLMGLFRNNGVYVLAFLVVCVLAAYGVLCISGREGKRKFRKTSEQGVETGGQQKSCHEKYWKRFLPKLAVLLVVCILGIQGGFMLLQQATHAESGSVAEMLSVPCQQLARTYVYHQEEISKEDQELLFTYIPEEGLKGYKYYVSDPVKAYFQAGTFQENPGEFVKLWLRLGRQFPGEYLQATLYNTMGIWYLGGDSSCYVVYDNLPSQEVHSLLPVLNQGYRWFTDDHLQKLPVLSLIFYTSTYAWLTLFCCMVLLDQRKYADLIPGLLLIGYMLTLILGPCILVRYFLGVMLCAPVWLGSILSPEKTV